MQSACAEARKWLGATSPNPPVGAAALDDEGNILLVAAHQRAGMAHAEAALIEKCRGLNILHRVKTLCVTLEPCNHHGRTPPCTEAIINSGIRHVVVGTRDPNAFVKGGGIECLQQAGIEVTSGVAENECRQLIHAFAYHAKTGRPWVTIKRAFDENGGMIPPIGQKTFTSEASLILAHRLRKKADAILTGSGTILADQPAFTVRHVADFSDKRRFLAVLDGRNRVTDMYFQSAKKNGLTPLKYDNIDIAIKDLTEIGARDILIEAGPRLSQSVLDSRLWNMSVTILKGAEDRVEVEFNLDHAAPFDIQHFNWNNFLPA